MQKTVKVPKAQYLGRTVDAPVAIQGQVPTMMHRGGFRDDEEEVAGVRERSGDIGVQDSVGRRQTLVCPS